MATSERKAAVLLTSVGSLVGHSMLEALGPLRERYFLIGTNTTADAPALQRCDLQYLVPPTADGDAFMHALGAIIERERPALVLPTRDADLVPLGALKESLGDAPARFLCGGSACAKVLVDKYESYRFARDNGLAFVDTALGEDELKRLVGRHGYPLVAKPRRGYGTHNVYIVRSDEAARACLDDGRFVFQPYLLPPVDWSARLPDPLLGSPFCWTSAEENHWASVSLVAPGGDVFAYSAQHARQEAGKTVELTIVNEPVLKEIGQAWARALGMEEVRWTLDYFLEGHLPASGFPAPDGRRVVRLWQDWVIHPEAVAELRREGMRRVDILNQNSQPTR